MADSSVIELGPSDFHSVTPSPASAPVELDPSDVTNATPAPSAALSRIKSIGKSIAQAGGAVASQVGAGAANIVRHPVSFIEGLIPGGREAQQAYSHGLTPEQIQSLSVPTSIGTLARFGLLTPERLEEEEAKARENAQQIARSPVRRALVAALAPEAAPLQAAEYAVAGRALGAAEEIPGVRRLVGEGLRRAATEGAAIAGGFQAAEEAKRAAQGQVPTAGQATADILTAMTLGSGFGSALGLPDYIGRLRLRGRLAQPLEEAEAAPGPAEPAPAPAVPPAVELTPEEVRTVSPEQTTEQEVLPFERVPAQPTESIRYSASTAPAPEAPTEAARIQNLFGPGFVTTGDLDAAQQAAGERGSITQVRERPELRMLNLDEPWPAPLRGVLRQEAPAIDPSRPLSAQLGEIPPAIMAQLGNLAEAQGFAGFERTTADAGTTRVYFNPARDVTFTEPTATSMAALEAYPGTAIRRIPVADIKTAPELYQYKIGYNKEGAGLALNKARRFNERLGGVVTLVPDAEDPGKYFMVNGHQRLSLARRTGQDVLNAQVLPAGTTPAQARAIGARINIAEGRGTAVDAAKWLRDSGTTPEQLADEGLDLSEGQTQDAVALRNLSEPLFREVATGRMNAGRGVVIGRELPGNEPAQEAIARSVRELERKGENVGNAKLAEMIKLAQGTANVAETQTDLFGAHTMQKSLVPEKATILSHVREQLSKDRRLFGGVARNKARLETGGTQVGLPQATAISEGAGVRLDLLDRTAYRSGTAASEILNRYARALHDTPKAGRVGVLADAYREMFDALDRDYQAAFRTEAPAGLRPEAGPGQGNLLTGAVEQPVAAQQAPEQPAAPTAAELEAAGQRQMFEAAPSVALSPGDVRPARNGGGKGFTDLGVAVIPGLREFIERDVVPTGKEAVSAARETRQAFKRLFAPASVSEEGFSAAAIVARRRAELANDRAIAQRGLQSAERFMAPMPQSVKDEFIDRMERGQEQRTPELQAVAGSLRELLDRHRVEIQGLGRQLHKPLLVDFYETYFPHLWKDPAGVESFYQARFGPRGSLSGRGSFLKQRTFDYYAEARAAGFEPAVDNPVTMAALKSYEMSKYASGVRIMEDLKNEGLLKFVRFGDAVPAGYSAINDKLARVFRPAEIMGREVGEATLRQGELYEPQEPVTVHETHTALLPTGQWYGPVDVARIIDRYLSPGLRSRTGETPTNAYDAIRAASNVLNQVQLGMSAFHVTTTAANAGVSDLALAIQKAARGDVRGAVASFARSTPGVGLVQDIFGPGRKMYRQFYGMSDYGPKYQKAVADYIKSGAHFEQSRQFIDNWTNSFRDALAQGNVMGAGLRAPFAALEQLSKPIFQYLVPRAKAASFLRLNEFEQAKLPATASELDRIKAAYQVQNSMDNRFGELLYDKLFWDNRWRDVAFALGRAPGWLLGTIRELGGGAADILAGKMTGRAAYTLALPMWTALWGSVLQYAVTGTLPEVTGNIRDTLRNLFAPTIGTGPDGKPIRVWLPTYMKEVYHIGAAFDDLYYGNPSTALRYIAGKANPAVQLATDVLSNRAYPNVQVRDPNAPISEQIAQAARVEGASMLPFTIQNALRESQAGASATSAGGLSSFGLTPVPRSLSQSTFENYMDMKLGGRMAQAPETQADAARFRRRREAVQALRAGQSADLRDFSKSDLDYIRREASAPPLADRAMRMSLPEIVNGLRYATPAERSELVGVINRKLKNLRDLPPAQREHVVDQLNAGM
jgi:hypothetical protein